MTMRIEPVKTRTPDLQPRSRVQRHDVLLGRYETIRL